MLKNVKECPLSEVRRHTFSIVQVPVRCAFENSVYVEQVNGKHEWRSSAGGERIRKKNRRSSSRSPFHEREFASISSGMPQRPAIHWDRRNGAGRVERNIVKWEDVILRSPE